MHVPALSKLLSGSGLEVVFRMVQVAGVEGGPVPNQVRELSILGSEGLSKVRVAETSIVVVIIASEEKRALLVGWRDTQ